MLIRKLLFGSIGISDVNSDHISNIIIGLGCLIDDYQKFIDDFIGEIEDKKSSYFLPLAARSIIEVSSIALLCKFDPYRVIYSDFAKNTSGFDRTKPQPSSINWRNDIMPDNDLISWDASKSWTKQVRGLLAKNYNEAFWKYGFDNLVNFYDNIPNEYEKSNFIFDIKSKDDAFEVVKGNISRLYSHLSKGVHPEFCIGREVEFDKETLEDLIPKTIMNVAFLCLLQNFMPSIRNYNSKEEAYNLFKELENKYDA